jgi:hypothetical protein
MQIAISKAAAGGTKTAAAAAAGVDRKTLYRWRDADLDFLMEFDAAWRQGAKQRDYLAWLNHPFRGLRPPPGKRGRAVPRYVR